MPSLVYVLNKGDSITETFESYPYQYAGIPTDSTKMPASVLAAGPRTFVYRKSDATSTYVGINRAIAGTHLFDAAAENPSVAQLYVPSNRLLPNPRTSAAGTPGVRKPRKYIMTLMYSNPTTTTGAGAAAATGSYCLAMKSQGVDLILLGTIMPRGDNVIANYNTVYQQPFNTIVRDPSWQAANGVDAIMDFAADAIMGDPANLTNTNWFEDTVHPVTAGYARLAAIYGPALEPLVAMLAA